ncbi:MAG: twin-arginine translocase subunit TatB [Nitrospirae bacterium]|nr:twin-arginine translocase subunit TatB [Nitrospirota bacterium]
MGFSELLIIAVVVLLIFGPKRLPEVLKKVGGVMRDVRNAADDARATIMSNIESEGKKPVLPPPPPPVPTAPASAAPSPPPPPAPEPPKT